MLVLSIMMHISDFRFGLEQPVHINIIRDPINRFVSNYFFRRFGDWRSELNHQIRTPGMKDEERYLVSLFLSRDFLALILLQLIKLIDLYFV